MCRRNKIEGKLYNNDFSKGIGEKQWRKLKQWVKNECFVNVGSVEYELKKMLKKMRELEG